MALATSLNAAQLQTAISSRTVIGQAQGILMGRLSMDADQAFAVLRRVSSRTNTKLATVARQLVDTRQTPG